jgi:hypothetical protein
MGNDNELEEILKKLSENPNNKIVKKKEIIVIYNGKGEGDKFGTMIPIPVVTLDPTDKFAQFHDEYTIIASEVEELKPLMKYIQENGYNSNLD